MNTVAERVRKVIAENANFPLEEVTSEKVLGTDLGMDSLNRFELTIELEDEFGIEITDKESAPLNTVGEIVALIERKVGVA